jgi:hypothetical protein
MDAAFQSRAFSLVRTYFSARLASHRDISTSLHHAYFGYWIVCGILTGTPFLHQLTAQISLPVEGVWYPLPGLTAWLNGHEMYQHSFYAWYWHEATGLRGTMESGRI